MSVINFLKERDLSLIDRLWKKLILEKINLLIARTNSGYPAGTKVYRALISQTGVADPTAIVLENTFSGTPTFSYSGVGTYVISLSDAFPEEKTWFNVVCKQSTLSETLMSWGSTGTIGIETTDLAGAYIDAVLYKTPIEIIVYP